MSSKKFDSKKTSQQDTVEVLYQKMGDRWFAFSLIDDEVFFGSIPQDALEQKNAWKDPVEIK